MLHAPIGAGKTTLAAQWAATARERGERVEWYDAATDGPDPAPTLAGLAPALEAPAGGRAALVVDRADALGLDRLLALVDLVRRRPALHLILCLRGDHRVVHRLRTEVESQVLTAVDLALDAAELRDLVEVPHDVLAWTGGHVGTVVSGLPVPGAGGGWSRACARAYLGVCLDAVGRSSDMGIELLSALGRTTVGPATLTELLAGLGGDPLGDLEQVGSVQLAHDGLLLGTTPALREVLRDRVGLGAWGPDLVGTVLRSRWWELLRDDPDLLRDLVATLPDEPAAAGPLATQLRAEGLVGAPVAAGDAFPSDLAAATVRALASRRRGDLEAATRAVRRGEAVLDGGDGDCAHPAVVRRFALEAGLVALETGELPAARRWWLRAHTAVAGETEAAALLALLAAIEADHDALATWRDRAGTGGPGGTDALRLACAIDALDRGELAEAGRQLAAAAGPTRPGRPGDLWYLAAVVGAELALLTPARSEALHLLRTRRAEHARRAPAGSFVRCALDAAELDLLLASGRATEAAAGLDRLVDSAAGRLLRGRLALMTGQLDVALAELAAVVHPPASLRRLRMEALLLTAEAHRRAGRTAAAQAASDELARRAPWPRLLDLLPGGPVHPASVEVVHLTGRERELLDLLRGSLPRDSIAATLFVSTNTVKTQLQSLYRKLGATTREEAVARAYALGLLDRPG